VHVVKASTQTKLQHPPHDKSERYTTNEKPNKINGNIASITDSFDIAHAISLLELRPVHLIPKSFFFIIE
jgi:hypothetical protein